MEIQTILRKLEPLLPKKTKHWRRTLDIAEPEVKVLLERQIRYIAHQVLGDFRTKPLLSLPAENKSKGTFHLGKII